jgi:ABC-type nitrate/sulfonate/bicarbonate transport system substrate-binding protein
VRAISFADRVKPMALNMGSVPTLASDLGFMSKEGLSVEIVECDGSPQALAALERGDADMAQVNISPVVAEVARGARLQVVWGNVNGNPLKAALPSPGGIGVMLVSSLSLSKVDDLKGARIGISLKGATNHLALVSFLRSYGIDPETGVRWVEGGTPIERVNKVIDGAIDATWTTSQTLALFERRRDAFRILASGKELAEGGGIAFLVVVAKAELVEAEPQTVQSLVKALIKASRDFSENPEGWVAAAAKRRPEVDKEMLTKLWLQSRGHWPVNGRLDPGVAEETAKMLVKSGEVLAVPSVPAKEWVEMRFVDAALGELGEWRDGRGSTA